MYGILGNLLEGEVHVALTVLCIPDSPPVHAAVAMRARFDIDVEVVVDRWLGVGEVAAACAQMRRRRGSTWGHV